MSNEANSNDNAAEVPTTTPRIWKISHGGESFDSMTDDERTLFMTKNIVVVHGDTPAKASSKITQGDNFIDGIKEGDFFYLCYGNNDINPIKLFGRFTTDTAVENNDKKMAGMKDLMRSYSILCLMISIKGRRNGGLQMIIQHV